ncbi:MAG: hypothetical protein LBV28_03785 [Puniceicoccales bacterium]|jgi:hypothetical protein|nr:hypothetical protein [Puniceicoccales bacterium]
MTLFNAYIASGAVLTASGLALASGTRGATAALRGFPRSTAAAVVFFGGGAVWFLWGITRLGESDLAGFPREWMLGIFGVAGLLAFKFLPDLLAVRGLAVLMLLSARALLDAGYMQVPHSLVLATTAYAFVVLGVWWGAAPYVFRDWSGWVLEKRPRTLAVGVLIGAVGLANLISAFFVPASA